MVRPTSVKDVDQDEAVTRIAHFLKQVPEWSDLVKLSVMKDMALVNQDWYYISPDVCTSVLRSELTLSRKQAPSWSSAQQLRPSDEGSENLNIRQSRSHHVGASCGEEGGKECGNSGRASQAGSERCAVDNEDHGGLRLWRRDQVRLVGLGDALTMLAKKPKMSVLDKSNLDWKLFKQEQKIGEDLAIPNSGNDGYLNKQDFLLKADHAQFEKERAMRDTIRKQNQ